MKSLINIGLPLLALITVTAYSQDQASFQQVLQKWQPVKCVGMDGEGKTMNVMLVPDPKNPTLNVNNQMFTLKYPTKGNNGMATDDYQTADGKTVYASITNNSNVITLYQYDSASDNRLAAVTLTCQGMPTTTSSTTTSTTTSAPTSSAPVSSSQPSS